MSENNDKQVVIVQQDNTLKTVFIVLLTLSIVFICCAISCISITIFGALVGNISNKTTTKTNPTYVPQYKTEEPKFNVELKKVETEGTKVILTLNVKNTGKTGSVFSTANLNLKLDNNTPLYGDYFANLSLAETLNKYIAPGATVVGKVNFDLKDQVAERIDLEVKDSSYKLIQTIKVK